MVSKRRKKHKTSAKKHKLLATQMGPTKLFLDRSRRRTPEMKKKIKRVIDDAFGAHHPCCPSCGPSREIGSGRQFFPTLPSSNGGRASACIAGHLFPSRQPKEKTIIKNQMQQQQCTFSPEKSAVLEGEFRTFPRRMQMGFFAASKSTTTDTMIKGNK